MKLPVARGLAALLFATAALTAACSNNDPTAPAAPNAARTPVAGPSRSSGYAVAWGKDGGTSTGTSTGTTAGVTGGVTTAPVGGATTNSGYAVAWGKDGGTPSGQ